ncbi:MAG: PAS domain S-box protein, partial [Gemmatimonadota bacterium]
VITYVLMPVMDGYELVKQLRRDPGAHATPVVFYTAHYGEFEARMLAQSLGVLHVLTKPAEAAKVLEIVDRVLIGASTAVPVHAGIRPEEVDREHLRLVTDKLSEKAGDLKHANARLRALINIGLELSAERDADRLLQRVCVAARDLFSATYVTLGIVDIAERRVRRFITCGAEGAGWVESADSVQGMIESVVTERRTFRGANPGGDPATLRLPREHPEVHTFLAAPIASPTQVYGWICFVGHEGKAFTEDDENLVMALSGQVGRIYENSHLYETAMQRTNELARSEARKAAVLDSVLDCIVTIDAQGTVVEFNAAAEQTFGYTKAEAVGRALSDLIIPPAFREAHKAGMARYRSTGVGPLLGKVIEITAMRSDGSIIPVELAITAILTETPTIFTGVMRDITQRKRTEDDVRNRAMLSSLAATVGLALTRSESLATALRQCAEALVTHLGAAFARIWTLNEREAMLELQASAGQYTRLDGPHGKIPLGQFKIGRIARDRKPHLTNLVMGDPEVIDQEWPQREEIVSFAGHPLVVDDRVVGVMAVFSRHALSDHVLSNLGSVAQHIALGIERHRSAEALRTAEERVRFALESADVGIWDMDYRTGVLRWSETIEAQYGLQPGTFDGTVEMFTQGVHPEDRQILLDTIDAAMKTGSDFTTLHRTIWPDSTVRWLSGAGRIQLDHDGKPMRGVGISQDVTERRLLEEQYQQAQKMEAIGRLAGGVAHDFNNLLTAILGYCDLLLGDLDPSNPTRADIEEIQKAGMRASGLTRQLLAFSRKQIIEPTLLDLNAVVSDMEPMLERLIGEDVTIVLALRSGPARVMADHGQVEQIVMNLAVNARDAMPRGGRLTIQTEQVELDENYTKTHHSFKPGHYVALTVTDTGTGMTPDVQARLFEPFFTTKELGKGTGLGLATVHGMVTRSGGSVQVYSEVDRGSSFKVYFPIADHAEMTVPLPVPVSSPRVGVQTVLVVEDESGLRELARRLLERQGYKVLLAANAADALALFDLNGAIDVVLTDVVMPGGSGPDLIKKLVERQPALKVIYMSGYTEETISHHGILDPGIAFLHKPFTADSLGRKLREILD